MRPTQNPAARLNTRIAAEAANALSYTLLPGFEDAAASGVVEGIIDVSQATVAEVKSLKADLQRALAAVSYLTKELAEVKAKQLDDRKEIAAMASDLKGEKGLAGRVGYIEEYIEPEDVAHRLNVLEERTESLRYR